jgi:hypothetical protein
VDREDRVVIVQFPGEKVLKFQFFDILPQGFEFFPDLFKKDITAFFIEDPQRLLDVGQPALDSLKRRYRTFKPGFFLEELSCLFRRRPDLFLRKVSADLRYLLFFLLYIKDNLGALRSWPSTKPSLL